MFSSWWKDRAGDAATAGSVGGSGSGFTMDGEPVRNPLGLILGAGAFQLHEGSMGGTGSKKAVSVFHCSSSDAFQFAKESLKRIKTLRHPSVVTFFDATEGSPTKGIVSIATESVVPLLHHLQTLSHAEPTLDEEYKAWGVMQVFRGLGFVHEIGLIHGCLHSGSLFVTPGLEWKIFGFELTRKLQQEGQDARDYPGFPSSLSKYAPPEPDSGKTGAFDVWGLGAVVWEVFNGPLQAMSQLGKLGKIPAKLGQTYVELVAKNPAKRPNLKERLERMKKPGEYFSSNDNDLIRVMSFLEEFQIKDESEKSRFFSSLTKKLDKFPPDLCVHKILPDLIKTFDYSNAGPQILAPVFKIGKHLSSQDYQDKIVPCLIKLFASSDRNARYKLLCQLENFVGHLNNKIVNDQVFPQVVTGFVDQQPVIREKTVMSVIHLAPKLSFANLDETVIMKHFSRLLRDEQPGIRTNTTVCLGKVARHLHHQTRQKVLCGAFAAKLKDPFPPARIAAVNALAATQQFYTLQETSSRIVPLLCSLMTDPERPVRDQVFKVAGGFIEKLQRASEDPSLKEEMERLVAKNQTEAESSTASSWASWAVGAIGAKFYKSTSIKKPVAETPNLSSVDGSGSNRSEEADEIVKDVAADGGGGGGWSNDADEDGNWESLEQDVEKVSFVDGRQSGGQTPSPIPSSGGGWNDWDDDATKVADKVSSEADERKRLREEKRMARQRELEAKRASRKVTGGAMKLGSKLS